MRLHPVVRTACAAVVLSQAFCYGLAQNRAPNAVTPVASADAACGRCHGEILRKYLDTPMANASGRALDHAIPGSFYHAASKITYRLFADDQAFWLSYARNGGQTRQKLEYFMGSGHLGVTYLYSINGYLLESPVAYYGNLKAYDMKPGLGSSLRLPEALPMSSGCMRCHMSSVQRADPGTNNHYQGLPFLHGGINLRELPRGYAGARSHSRQSSRDQPG